MVPSYRTDELKRFINSDTGGKTIVIGGPSGTGKTCMALGLGLKQDMVVVYGSAGRWFMELKDIDLKEDIRAQKHTLTAEEVKERLAARNTDMLDLLVRVVTASVPANVRSAMQCEERWGAHKVRVVVVMDEMGNAEFSEAVSAMCALTGSDLCKAMEWPSNKVTVHLVVVGTGLGSGEVPVGSTQENYKVLFSHNFSMAVNDNELIFGALFPNAGSNSIALAKYHNGLVNMLPANLQLSIRTNSRMGAILSHEIYKTMKALCTEDPKVIFGMDELESLYYGAACTFKRLNALEKVTLDGIWELLIMCTRVHYFPNCRYHHRETVRKLLEVRCGLLVDNMTWDAKDYTPSPRYHLPTFSVLLLARLGCIKVVTQSAADGATFEQYVHGVLHLLACASMDASYFRAALLGPSGDGALEPLHYHVPEGDAWPYAKRLECKRQVLPTTPSITLNRSLVSLSRDLSEIAGTDISCLVATAMGQASTAESWKSPRASRVASFRSPRSSQFADVMVFIGDELFLIQCHNQANTDWLAGVHLERWSMGAVDDDAVTAFLDSKKDEIGTDTLPPSCHMFQILSEMKLQLTSAHSSRKSKTRSAVKPAQESPGAGNTLHDLLLSKYCELKSIISAGQAKGRQTKAETAEAEQPTEEERCKAAALLEYFAPRDTLRALALQWGQSTGIKLKRIHACFISPNADGTLQTKTLTCDETSTMAPLTVNFSRGGGSKVEFASGELYLSTDKLEFLKFDAARKRQTANENGARVVTLNS
eukprot:GILI01028329.1.p1 GENE.GILI01028329.1~~GILI01028329.1.p1  ORF type:complete len:800 (+),score=86.95 GILI01028329.1:111-2402(+)